MTIPDLERKLREYTLARDKVDKIIDEHSDDIQKNLRKIVEFRSEVFIELVNQWAIHCDKLNYPFSGFVDVSRLNTALGEAYTEYIRYAFYYRFANNLARNIIYRKIFSFELHFFYKRGVLSKHSGAISPSLEELSPDARLYHVSPLMHFFSYRLLKEFRIRGMTLAEQPLFAPLFRRVQSITTQKLLDFITIHSSDLAHDDFRNYLSQRGNEDINSVFEFVEKMPTKSTSLFHE